MAMSPEQRKAASERMKARHAAARNAASTEQPAPVTPTVTEIKGKPRNLFSGTMKKFEVIGKNGSSLDPIPGYVLHGFNDTEGGLRISRALASGWQFVDKDEVMLNDAWNTPLNNDLGSHVRMWVEQGIDGNAVYCYIMKQPKELFEANQQEREDYHKQIEAALTMGNFNMTSGERRYTAVNPPVGSPSGLPPISISHKRYR